MTIKPIIRRSPAWRPKPAVELDWAEAFRPRPLGRIGVALEHDPADAEILNRALGLAQTQSNPSEIVLLHVVDTPMTRVLGPEIADQETGADERYLDGLVDALRKRGYPARAVLLYGPDPAGELVAHLKRDPVDLLVVGSHGHGLVRDLLLGQTVDRVRHNLEVPMLIARPGRDGASHPSRSLDCPRPTRRTTGSPPACGGDRGSQSAAEPRRRRAGSDSARTIRDAALIGFLLTLLAKAAEVGVGLEQSVDEIRVVVTFHSWAPVNLPDQVILRTYPMHCARRPYDWVLRPHFRVVHRSPSHLIRMQVRRRIDSPRRLPGGVLARPRRQLTARSASSYNPLR